MEKLPVFVYGTLRRGLHNNYIIDSFEHEMEPATIQGTLVVDGLPYYFGTGDIDSVVHGELITFSDDDFEEAMWRLDVLEGHPDHYTRVRKRTTDGVLCYIYEIQPMRSRRVSHGDYTLTF